MSRGWRALEARPGPRLQDPVRMLRAASGSHWPRFTLAGAVLDVAPHQVLQVAVAGIPRPKGSKTAAPRPGGGVWMRESSKALPGWMAAIRQAATVAALEAGARPAVPWCPDAPVAVEAVFFMPRPKRMPRDRVFPTGKPDGDKLERAILDAITGPVIGDDSRVVGGTWSKAYAPAFLERVGFACGVVFAVVDLSPGGRPATTSQPNPRSEP